jgi:hypothetical protein
VSVTLNELAMALQVWAHRSANGAAPGFVECVDRRSILSA